METFDTNYWGLLVVPVGVLLCFGPALVVWMKQEFGKPAVGERKDRRT